MRAGMVVGSPEGRDGCVVGVGWGLFCLWVGVAVSDMHRRPDHLIPGWDLGIVWYPLQLQLVALSNPTICRSMMSYIHVGVCVLLPMIHRLLLPGQPCGQSYSVQL